ALDITGLTASARGIHIRLHLMLDPAPVLGDRVRLLQVVWNLLSNAVKFTPDEGQIDVRLERYGNDLRLLVTDTGTGISAEFLPHVFELYRQGDATSTHSPGLGIGLSVVAQIVKQHGGTASVESAGLGHGSTFLVTLPLRMPLATTIDGPKKAGRRSGKTRRADGRRLATNNPEEHS
ncbi:MAG TPA: ATP-binding protein, partial [Thermoanaerobaculia bacterium]|nr:ATP-binding protein [Thermoanaerobaculia bacterium]